MQRRDPSRLVKPLLVCAALTAPALALVGCVVYCADPVLYYFTLTSDNNNALLEELGVGEDDGGDDHEHDTGDATGTGGTTGDTGDATGATGDTGDATTGDATTGDTGDATGTGGTTGDTGDATGTGTTGTDDTSDATTGEAAPDRAALARHRQLEEDTCIAACELLMDEAYGYGTVDACEVNYDAGDDSYTYACLVYDDSCK